MALRWLRTWDQGYSQDGSMFTLAKHLHTHIAYQLNSCCPLPVATFLVTPLFPPPHTCRTNHLTTTTADLTPQTHTMHRPVHTCGSVMGSYFSSSHPRSLR